MGIGEKIKRIRSERGMNAETLADKIGVSASTVYRWENGDVKKVDGDSLTRIADALSVSVKDIMDWSDSVDNNELLLTEEERSVITLWRALPPDLRKGILGMIRGAVDNL